MKRNHYLLIKLGKSNSNNKMISAFFAVFIMVSIPICMPSIDGVNIKNINIPDTIDSNNKIEKNDIILTENNSYENSLHQIRSFFKIINLIKKFKSTTNINSEELSEEIWKLLFGQWPLIYMFWYLENWDNPETCVDSKHFEYYWNRAEYVRTVIVDLWECPEPTYECWHERSTNYFGKGGWMKFKVGWLMIGGGALTWALGWTERYKDVALATPIFFTWGFVILYLEFIYTLYAKNFMDAIQTKEVDILIKLIDENGKIIDIQDKNYLPYGFNPEVKKTNHYMNSTQEEQVKIEERFTYKFNKLNEIDYSQADNPDVAGLPPSVTCYDGWYSLSSREPNPTYSIVQFPAPPGYWDITVPWMVYEGEIYNKTTFDLSGIIPGGELKSNCVYVNDSIVLEKDTRWSPEVINPKPKGEDWELMPEINFTVHDNQTPDVNDPNGPGYLSVRVETNNTRNGQWDDLLDFFEISHAVPNDGLVSLPTNEINWYLDSENILPFITYNTTYYWRVKVTDTDSFDEDHPLHDLAPFTYEKTYNFTTIKK